MNATLRNTLALASIVLATQAAAQVTFYEREGFAGRSFTTNELVHNFERYGFNDRASAVVVSRNPWEVCEDIRFTGRCVVLRPGRYPSLAAMGVNDRVSSAPIVGSNSRIEESRYAPVHVLADDYRRTGNERLYDASVTSARAVVGPPERRCWVEREQVVEEVSTFKIPGALAGAVIGGILGHQVGGGRGQDIATAGGAVAGAAVGASVGRGDGGQQVHSRDVERCENVASHGRPDYWDVTYDFRGEEHRVQMNARPGATITVNQRGEPSEPRL